MNIAKRVAFLCTGDELVHGDIVDTNSQYFAQQLLSHGMHPGRKVVVSDDQAETEAAMHYLLADHDALITIGGLGPTSDDRTRFALADFLQQPLVVNEKAWNWIVELITSKGLTVPDNNRQQALLPKNAELIHNAHGTAAAFYVHDKGKDIFTLPGPPNECRSIFDEVVIPQLKKAHYGHPVFRHRWLLLGVSEGLIAEALDPLVIDTACEVGYRVRYPYLEVKLYSENKTALQSMVAQFEEQIGDNSVSADCEDASRQFLRWLEENDTSVSVNDAVTRGQLAALLTRPTTYQKISFQPTRADIQITLKGLDDYWSDQTDERQRLPFSITVETAGKKKTVEKAIFQRQQQTLAHAVEIICWELIKYLRD